jgi:arylsulfatase A-like enzyme
MLKGYFAAVTAMDANIGRIVEKVEELGLRENTLIIFTSDNGFSCGHHGFWGKGNGTFPINMYENSVKVPMIISHPSGLPEGETVDAMMSQYDVMPTLLDYLGLAYTEDPSFPGVSFVPVLKGDKQEVRDDVVVYDEYGPVRMIRTREWKYIHRFPYGAHELYDMVNDPDERKNLINDESKGSVVRELRGRLFSWFDNYVDPRYDGSVLPVSGSGQKDKIGRTQNGYECFYTDRLVINEKGGPEVKIPYRMDYDKNYS